MPVKNNNTVSETYEKIVKWYDAHRSRELFEKPYLDKVISHLKPGAAILDCGCGMGEPIGKYFFDNGFLLTGVDSNSKFIELAKSRFPKCRFLVADMRGLVLNEKFDAVIAWNSFFHLSPDDQRKMFKTFEDHLNVDGILMFTSGPEAGETWSDNGGENLYHASLSANEYKQLLGKHNFKLMQHAVEDKNCGGSTVWIARLLS
jgi:ubiquinone/menaquinone biosynthesis C-methylase UbiE